MIHLKAIVIYSKTGNTRSVAHRLVNEDSILLEVVPMVDNPNLEHPELKISPDIQNYEHIVLGSPVHGFMLSNVMKTYIKQTDFSNKKVDLFVTHFFPFAWMGGKQTLKQMKKLIEEKGGNVGLMPSINWKNRKREQDINLLVESYKS